MKKRRTIYILLAVGIAVICTAATLLLLLPPSTPQSSQTSRKSQLQPPQSSDGQPTVRPTEPEVELPVLSEAEAGLTVYNAYAADVTKSGATVKLTLTRTFVQSYTLLLGDSPDTLAEVGRADLGEARSSISHALTGLSEHTRYYFAFWIRTDSQLIQTDISSFVTPDDYYDGSAGGKGGENARYGIDVSYWNESIDFTRLADQNIDFVILRAGSTKGKDPYFEEHYEQAKAAGLKVGAYYYTYAVNLAEIEQDAEDCLSYISGKTFDYPVYLDMENEAQKSLSRRLLTEMAITFCERIAGAGCYPGIYASRNWYLLRFNTEVLSAVYELWVAAWTSDGQPNRDYSSGFGMWQYYDKGRIDGVPGYSDLNVCYKDYPAIIRG